VTAVAVYAFWFWALRPLGFASYLSSITATDADIIRQYWPHRLVQPEWVSSTPDRLLNWSFAEAVVRSSVVGIFWLITTGTFIYVYMSHRQVRPNTSLEPTADAVSVRRWLDTLIALTVSLARLPRLCLSLIR